MHANVIMRITRCRRSFGLASWSLVWSTFLCTITKSYCILCGQIKGFNCSITTILFEVGSYGTDHSQRREYPRVVCGSSACRVRVEFVSCPGRVRVEPGSSVCPKFTRRYPLTYTYLERTSIFHHTFYT